jgi:hypothetical protein
MFRKPVNFLSNLETLQGQKRKSEASVESNGKRPAASFDPGSDAFRMPSPLPTRVHSALPLKARERNDLVLPSMRLALSDLRSREDSAFAGDHFKQFFAATKANELQRVRGGFSASTSTHRPSSSSARPAFLHRQQSQPKRTPTETFTVMGRKAAPREGERRSDDDYTILPGPNGNPPDFDPSALAPIPAKRPLSSKYKGVSWNREKGKWAVYLSIDGENIGERHSL